MLKRDENMERENLFFSIPVSSLRTVGLPRSVSKFIEQDLYLSSEGMPLCLQSA